MAAPKPPTSAVEAAKAEILKVVDENLDWNLRAYGKAWTGEGEDTEFIVGDSADRALAAAYPAILEEIREKLLSEIEAAAREVEEAICGYVVGGTPKEDTLDAVDEEFVCKRCLAIGRKQPSTPQSEEGGR